MRLWPFKSKKDIYSGDVQIRPNVGQGPWSAYYQNFIARKINTELMEVMRESVPVIDAAINRLVSLDGHIVVKGNNDRLVDEIQDWIDHVPVNGLSKGIQKFHQNFTDEAHEQGFSVSEFVMDRQKTGITELRVADSKHIKFKRDTAKGGFSIWQKSDDDTEHRILKPGNLMYYSIHNENMNPYGIPLMRSCEFCSDILLTIQNSIKNSWERFGDPSYSVVYKTSKKDGSDHDERRKQIAKELDEANRAKKDGKSVDFVRAIDTNSDIIIKVIGADGQVLEMEVPARHVLEQIVAKTGLPPWMLGMHWSTTESLSTSESEMLLADVVVRRSPKTPLFHNLVAMELRLRGRTWKKGDWWLEWAGVNLRDIVAQAQARFLNGQADMYYMQNAAAAGIPLDLSDLALGKSSPVNGKDSIIHVTKSADSVIKATGHVTKSHETVKEPRSEAWPELDQIEDEYATCLINGWNDLYDRVRLVLGFGLEAKTGEESVFSLSTEQIAQIEAAMKAAISAYSTDSITSSLVRAYNTVISAGFVRAAGSEPPLLSILKNSEIFDTLKADGFQLVKNNFTRAIKDKILAEMQAHAIAGSNPNEVAGRLKKLFGDKNSDWRRLARSEMAMAAEKAKVAEWKAREIETLDFVPAPDACPICKALAGTYPIDDCPVPVEDTHPNCRCATRVARE